MKSFDEMLLDLEQLIGLPLNSISGQAAPFRISEIDRANDRIVLALDGTMKSRPLEELRKIWKEMCERPCAHVESVLGGSGSSRSQPETILGSLPYVEWLNIKGKKHIAYIVDATHERGTLKKMSDDKAAQYEELMHLPRPRNPLLPVTGSSSVSDHEALFKAWLARQKKPNGENYSANTQYQYVNALRVSNTEFAEYLQPIKSIFDIGDMDVLDRYVSRMKSDDRYEDYNRKRGNGALSAGLEMYRRFLEETIVSNDELKKYSPNWFREKAKEYPTLDSEALALLQDFQKKFAPNILAALEGENLLNISQ